MKFFKQSAPRSESDSITAAQAVSDIISDVRKRGDTALLEYNKKFDGNDREILRVSGEEIQEAYFRMTDGELEDLRQAAANIREFALAQLDCMKPLSGISIVEGSELGHRVIPVSSCGCYVPGGSYPLFSTALMLVIPAKAAGVRRVVACSPSEKGSTRINYKTLVAMHLAGADEIYVMGGAQSIAAMTYGTDSISPVDMIVGPGNRYVAEAKRQCYGQVGIDFFAGPSEVLVIADSSADADIIAADILAQSEHDRLAKGILITDDESLAGAVAEAVERQLGTIDTADIARDAWETYGEIIIVDDMQEACAISNDYAPEHLEVIVRDESILDDLVNFGSLFIGQETGEVFGDYASGTNHTLPTVRAARYTGGVWAGTFLKVCSYQRYNRSAMSAIAPLVSRMAHGEGLTAHARAAEIRMERLK